MDAKQEICFDRRKEYDEQQRILLSRLMSERGGMLTKDFTENEIEGKMTEFLKEMAILDYKFIDIVREDWGLDPEDNTAMFGEDMENRWTHFIKNHIVKDNEGKESIIYEDKDNNFRLIPGVLPLIENLGFVIENYQKLRLSEREKEEVDEMPSITMLGIEALSGEKYLEYNLEKEHKDFFITQVMILLCELMDILSKYQKYLKEESGNELFKLLSEKVKGIF